MDFKKEVNHTRKRMWIKSSVEINIVSKVHQLCEEISITKCEFSNYVDNSKTLCFLDLS